MLLEYLKENYNKNEPIFVSDIDLPVSDTNLRQMFKVLCDKGEIRRYDTGIYYLPGASRLKGGTEISASEVARYKYVARNEKVIGYYNGYTFANQLGLTMQVPFTIEIVSNQASAKCREVNVRNQKIMLRRPRIEVTKENYVILQLLDLVKDIEQYMDEDVEWAESLIFEYVKQMRIARAEVDQYIGLFPERIYKNIYEMRLYNAFA
jgi:predicted transcriptional regulator of viral defense system